jgi:hypothetical protein
VDSYLGLLFCYICLHICFCTSTVLFSLLWLCRIIWSGIMVQHCSFCSVLPNLHICVCASTVLFSLLQLCTIVWSWVLWIPPALTFFAQ